jgi:P-loop containing dynein motor region
MPHPTFCCSRYNQPQDVPVGHATMSSPMFPLEATVYDYFFDLVDQTWLLWSTKLSYSQPIPLDSSFRKIIVPTVATTRYTFLLDNNTQNGFPTLLIGPTGTGVGTQLDLQREVKFWQDRKSEGIDHGIINIRLDYVI